MQAKYRLFTLVTALLSAPISLPSSVLACSEWAVPPSLKISQSNGYNVIFFLIHDTGPRASRIFGTAHYRALRRNDGGRGVAEGTLKGDQFDVRHIGTPPGRASAIILGR
jgi:hypothetical protein